MEAEHSLDPKKLTEELEKMTEVRLVGLSGRRQSSSLIRGLWLPRDASLSSKS
jgi:hypothetical protein